MCNPDDVRIWTDNAMILQSFVHLSSMLLFYYQFLIFYETNPLVLALGLYGYNAHPLCSVCC